MKAYLLGAIALSTLGASAAQTGVIVPQSIPAGEPRRATYSMATGQVTPESEPGHRSPLLEGDQIIFNNTAASYSYTNLGAYIGGLNSPIYDGHDEGTHAVLVGPTTMRVGDEGGLPGTPYGGPSDVYEVSAFQIAYVTTAIDASLGGPGSNVRISFWNAGEGVPCAQSLMGPPVASFLLQGLPGHLDPTYQQPSTTYVVTVELTSEQEFELLAFGYGGGGDQYFAWTFEWLNDEAGGPIISGDPQGRHCGPCPPGTGTFGDLVGGANCTPWLAGPIGSGFASVSAHSIGWIPGDDEEDCYWFGNYYFPPFAPFASFFLRVMGHGVDDPYPPTIVCPPPIRVFEPPTGAPGEIVTFTVPAFDDQDPAPSVVCTPPSGSLFPRGTTLVTCTATDASGNQSSCAFPVTVELDETPPTLFCPESVRVRLPKWAGSGTNVAFSVTALDTQTLSPVIHCSPPAGSYFPRGTTMVTCTATDSVGNTSTCQFPVIVGPLRQR